MSTSKGYGVKAQIEGSAEQACEVFGLSFYAGDDFRAGGGLLENVDGDFEAISATLIAPDAHDIAIDEHYGRDPAGDAEDPGELLGGYVPFDLGGEADHVRVEV